MALNSSNVPADVLVIFGITGDLARKMTFRSLYRLERRKLLTCPIVGVARDGWSDDALRDHARAAIKAAGEPLDDTVFARFAARLSYVQGDYTDEETFHRLGGRSTAVGTPSSTWRSRRRCLPGWSGAWQAPG